MVEYSRQSVRLYKYLLAGGWWWWGGGHWYVLFVFLRCQRHAVSLHEAISYLISTDTHGSEAPPHPPSSSGARQLILHHFIFLFYRPGKWLPVPLPPSWQANLISALHTTAVQAVTIKCGEAHQSIAQKKKPTRHPQPFVCFDVA